MPLIGRQRVDEAIIKTVKRTNNKLKKVYFQGLREVITATPVDTGRARSNWFLSQNAPSGKTTDSLTRIDDLKLPQSVFGKVIYFTNNLPYIASLEWGSSEQAPKFWVRKIIKQMKTKIKAL